MGFVKSIVYMATHNAIYGNGKVPTSIKSLPSLIIDHAATNLLYLNLVSMYSIESFKMVTYVSNFVCIFMNIKKKK